LHALHDSFQQAVEKADPSFFEDYDPIQMDE
jgi:hypothetical protein